jgi:adenine phosphoribosyltransferase
LPYKTRSQSYTLEYGTDTLEVHEDTVSDSDRVIIVDDLLATGGTASATLTLIKSLGAEVVETAFLVELDFLKGREKLGEVPCYAMLHY